MIGDVITDPDHDFLHIPDLDPQHWNFVRAGTGTTPAINRTG
jgi:hypothetical protein